MIDTIKVFIPFSPELVRAIKQLEMNYWVKGKTTDSIPQVRILYGSLEVGSFTRGISFRINEERREISMEYSIPKYFYGHNIYLISTNDAIKAIKNTQKDLSKLLAIEFPSIDTWILQRVDLCYAWKLYSEEVAEKLIVLLNSLDFPRKRKHSFDTGVIFTGSSYSAKFYLKHIEYYKHDYKALVSNSKYQDLAYRLFDISKGVLRFELTLRKEFIDRVIKKDIISLLKDNELIVKILKDKLDKIMKTQNKEFMTKYEVFETLSAVYPKRTAKRLLDFYRDFCSDSNFKDIVKSCYSRQTIHKNMVQLSNANVGINFPELSQKFDLKIPSDYGVNAV